MVLEALGTAFDPKLELEKIRKSARQERPELLKQFKEKYLNQKVGIAKLWARLENLIRSNPDISLTRLNQETESFSGLYGFNQKQKDIISSVLLRYLDKHRAVKSFREKYQDNSQLFKALFGKLPKGEIEVITGPITLHFRIFDNDDYVYIHSGSYETGKVISDEDVLEANKSGGIHLHNSLIPELKGLITIDNAKYEEYTNWSRSVFIHEEQHAIFQLIMPYLGSRSDGIKLPYYPEMEYSENLLLKLFRQERFNQDELARNEILSEFKDGYRSYQNILNNIKKNKKDGGLYDHLDSYREDIKYWENFFQKNQEIYPIGSRMAMIKRSIHLLRKVYIDEYRQLLKDSVNAFKISKSLGYSPEETVALLMPEPLSKWPKIAKRFSETQSISSKLLARLKYFFLEWLTLDKVMSMLFAIALGFLSLIDIWLIFRK